MTIRPLVGAKGGGEGNAERHQTIKSLVRVPIAGLHSQIAALFWDVELMPMRFVRPRLCTIHCTHARTHNVTCIFSFWYHSWHARACYVSYDAYDVCACVSSGHACVRKRERKRFIRDDVYT